MKQIKAFEKLSAKGLCAIPFMNANGFHNKKIAYSLYHIFRIEGIVANALILKEQEIFFKEDYPTKMNSPIITTGMNLKKRIYPGR